MAYTPFPAVPRCDDDDGGGGGGGGSSVHNDLSGRSTYPAHPGAAIVLDDDAINAAGADSGWPEWAPGSPTAQAFAEAVAAQNWASTSAMAAAYALVRSDTANDYGIPGTFTEDTGATDLSGDMAEAEGFILIVQYGPGGTYQANYCNGDGTATYLPDWLPDRALDFEATFADGAGIPTNKMVFVASDALYGPPVGGSTYFVLPNGANADMVPISGSSQFHFISALKGWTPTRVWDGGSFELVNATIYVGPSAESAVADSDGDQYLATD